MTYTREQLDAMSDVSLGECVDRIANPEDKQRRREKAVPYCYWLTGDGMLALMEWIETRGSSGWCMGGPCGVTATVAIGIRTGACTHASAPRALAIAVVLAVQGQQV